MTIRTILVACCVSTPLVGAFVPSSSTHSSSTSIKTSIDVFKNPFADSIASTTNGSSSAAPPIQTTNANNPLIKLANEIVYTKSGFYSPHDESAYADDFVFRGPYIGPLNKADYLQTMDTFKLHESLPDLNPNAWGYNIDPKDPNRVWFMVRNTGTFDGAPLNLGSGVSIPPNGAVLDGCPETFSVTFDEDRKVKHLTVGYVADRFEGNTKGDGAAVGIFNAAGVPFPKPGPLLRFAQYLLTEIIPGDGAMSYSPKDVPEWWTEKSTEIASEGY